MAEHKHGGKHHKFHHTHIEHHEDGSATIHHQHEAGPEHDVKHAVPDLDGVHDSIEQHLGQPNEGENEVAGAAPQGAPGGVPGAVPASSGM
jgi:hypothetical protein